MSSYKCVIRKYGKICRTITGKEQVLNRFIKSLIYAEPEKDISGLVGDTLHCTFGSRYDKYTEFYVVPGHCKTLLEQYKPLHVDNYIMPIVFINCEKYHFVTDILTGKKLYETRNRNTLKSLVGKHILLAETGKGEKPVIRGIAYIDSVLRVDSKKTWNQYRKDCSIEKGSIYDWNSTTKAKYLYHLSNVFTCEPFAAPEGKRHGRTWMEYTETASAPLYLY